MVGLFDLLQCHFNHLFNRGIGMLFQDGIDNLLCGSWRESQHRQGTHSLIAYLLLGGIDLWDIRLSSCTPELLNTSLLRNLILQVDDDALRRLQSNAIHAFQNAFIACGNDVA